MPILLRKDHQGLLRVKDDIVQKIQKAIIGGAIITCDIPDFLKNAFRFEQLGVAAEEALGADVEENRLDRAVMEHIKTRKIWVFGDEAKSEEAKQKAALHYATQYQVFDPKNPLAPVNTPYLIVKKEDLAAHQASLEAHSAAKPSLAMVVDYGDATAINRSPALLNSARHISFVGPRVTTIGNNFLKECARLTSVDLRGLSGVITIRNCFLNNCKALKAVNLRGLSNVTRIGNNFLNCCTALKSVDLSMLSGVTTIGDDFLYYCTALESMNLNGLSEVTAIGKGFLAACSALKTMDSSPLSGVTTIGYAFLCGCKALKTVNLSGLSGVTTIWDSFLYGCHSLQAVDLNLLRNLTTIGNHFLIYCTALEFVDLSGLSRVTKVGDDFLGSGTKTSIRITGIPAPDAWALIKAQITRPITLT